MISFFIPGRPQPKERPRGGKGGRVFTPPRTRKYEAFVALLGKRAMGTRRPLSGALALSVTVLYARPKRIPNAMHPCWMTQSRCPNTLGGQYGDATNVAKAIEDALNGIVWGDDKQVTELVVRKLFVGVGEDEGVEVEVREVGL